MQDIVSLIKTLHPYQGSRGLAKRLTEHEIKDISKVIRYSEHKIILLKGTTRKITSQVEGVFNSLLTINDNCFTINEKCTYAIS